MPGAGLQIARHRLPDGQGMGFIRHLVQPERGIAFGDIVHIPAHEDVIGARPVHCSAAQHVLAGRQPLAGRIVEVQVHVMLGARYGGRDAERVPGLGVEAVDLAVRPGHEMRFEHVPIGDLRRPGDRAQRHPVTQVGGVDALYFQQVVARRQMKQPVAISDHLGLRPPHRVADRGVDPEQVARRSVRRQQKQTRIGATDRIAVHIVDIGQRCVDVLPQDDRRFRAIGGRGRGRSAAGQGHAEINRAGLQPLALD